MSDEVNLNELMGRPSTTTAQRLVELDKMRLEYYKDSTTHERKVEILLKVQSFAEEEMPESKCLTCGKVCIAIPDVRPRIEGHLYTGQGEREFMLSKSCEWCFDKMFLEPDDPRRAEWFPGTVTVNPDSIGAGYPEEQVEE